MCATVPILFKSSFSGVSIFGSFCAKTPIVLLPLYVSFTSLIERSLPIVIGIITPGKRTVFLSGRIGKVFGVFSLSILSSSSWLRRGKKSDSSSMSSDRDRGLNLNSSLFIIFVLTICQCNTLFCYLYTIAKGVPKDFFFRKWQRLGLSVSFS